MSDRLENFIRTNRKSFNELEPPENLWDKIETQLDETSQISSPHRRFASASLLFKLAASLIVVLTAVLVISQLETKSTYELSEIDPKLAKQQVYYASLINEKRGELQQIEKQDPQLYKEFSSEIKAMDENYQKLKSDLPSSPNQTETVKAMIRNLQIQIEVLNQQLKIIDQVNQLKKEQNNGTQSI